MTKVISKFLQRRRIKEYKSRGKREKKNLKSKDSKFFIKPCGERGIRTPGTSQYVGFQDRCNRPLCHLS